MNVSSENILKEISKGESETLEFKRHLPTDREFARLLTSFVNTKGGLVLIGVDDNANITGLNENEIKQIRNRIENTFYPLLQNNLQLHEINIHEKKILAIKVIALSEEDEMVITSSGDYFIRDGAEARTAAISKILARNYSHNLGAHIQRDKFIDQQKRSKQQKKLKIFVAMSFREEEEPSLVDYYNAMQRAITETSLPLNFVRIDETEGDYEISQKLMIEIDDSDILIADFTLSPANVYFELGYARGKGKRIIQTARHDTLLEFDTRNWRTIFYRNATELEAKLKPAIEIAYEEVVKELNSLEND